MSSPLPLLTVFTDPNHPDITQKTHQWNDQTVVLKAATDSGATIFHASRFILARESAVFAQMFSFDAPASESDERYEGLPLITVYDDPFELQYFLEAIHDHRTFFSKEISKEFGTVVALLRLGTKYQVNHLRERGIAYFAPFYPLNIESFTNQVPENKAATFNFAMLPLFRALNLRRFLPVLFYQICTTHSLESLIKAPVINDNPPSTTEPFFTDDGDIALCVRMRHKLALMQSRIRQPVLFTPSSAIDGHLYRNCDIERMRVALDCGGDSNHDMVPADLLQNCDPLDYKRFYPRFAREVCPPCVAFEKRSYLQRREKIWAELPGMCGLPSWEILLAEEYDDY